MTTARTQKQNNALHLYFQNLADALGAAGYDMKQVVEKVIVKADIPPTKQNVKYVIAHPIMKALYPDKDSTTQLSTVETQALYEIMNRAFAERLGISVAWPSEEEMRRDRTV